MRTFGRATGLIKMLPSGYSQDSFNRVGSTLRRVLPVALCLLFAQAAHAQPEVTFQFDSMFGQQGFYDGSQGPNNIPPSGFSTPTGITFQSADRVIIADRGNHQILENLDEMRAFAKGADVFPPIDDEGVRGIRAPVLLVTGDQSPSHLTVLTDRLEELLPDAERLEIPRASHLMHEDNAPAVNAAIVEFIDRKRASAG